MTAAAVLETWNLAKVFGRFGRRPPRIVFMPQADRAGCALACLGMVASYHRMEIDLFALRDRFATSASGTTLLQLVAHARALGFTTRPIRAEPEALRGIRLPAILHWDLNHFVVLSRVGPRDVEIHDPARGVSVMRWAEFGRHFTGIALELSPAVDFTPMLSRGKVSLLTLAGRIRGLGGALGQLIGLALIIEITALLIPLQLQVEFDQALPFRDTGLLTLIVVGMTAVVALQAFSALARAWAISWFGATLNAQWVINLFEHLLRVPLDYFQRRHVGDIVARFYSIRQIQTKLTAGFVEAVLDGVMSLGALGIMLTYSPTLGGIVAAALVLYVCLRQRFYRALWRTNEEQVLFGARQQSEFMDTIRGIQAIKLADMQGHRHARLANITMEGARLDMRSQSISLSLNVLNRAVFGFQRVAVVGLGAYFVMQDRLSAGMLVAFVVYADQFTQRGADLVDKVIEVLLLRTHTDRIADIALTAPETDDSTDADQPASAAFGGGAPVIELEDLGFRYAGGEPWIFRNLNLRIDAGQAVAITGPSGCGKSTLARLILGLMRPTEGRILIDGVDIRRLGMTRFRSLAAAVMQDDTLFSGSIAENISFFAADADHREHDVVACAVAAGVHDQITAMPMGYETLVGDMGTTLSGGQKQRIILSRALYRKPRILLLDEATSHLDLLSERTVNEAVAAMDITRIIIAHRPETIASAARVVDFADLRDAARTAARETHPEPDLAFAP